MCLLVEWAFVCKELKSMRRKSRARGEWQPHGKCARTQEHPFPPWLRKREKESQLIDDDDSDLVIQIISNKKGEMKIRKAIENAYCHGNVLRANYTFTFCQYRVYTVPNLIRSFTTFGHYSVWILVVARVCVCVCVRFVSAWLQPT